MPVSSTATLMPMERICATRSSRLASRLVPLSWSTAPRHRLGRVLGAEHLQQPAQFGDRLLAGALHRPHRAGGELRVLDGHPAGAGRLQHHHGDGVGDDVVQFAGDPKPLRIHGRGRQGRAGCLQFPGPRASGRARAPPPRGPGGDIEQGVDQCDAVTANVEVLGPAKTPRTRRRRRGRPVQRRGTTGPAPDPTRRPRCRGRPAGRPAAASPGSRSTAPRTRP